MSTLPLVQFADKLDEIMPPIMKWFVKFQSQELRKDRLTLSQALVLTLLDTESELKMKDLAVFMGVTTPAMTGIMERLVKNGYCKREYDNQDRRIIKISLTAKGNDQVKKINEYKRRMMVKIFGQMPETDRQSYLRILLQIKEILLNYNEKNTVFSPH